MHPKFTWTDMSLIYLDKSHLFGIHGLLDKCNSLKQIHSSAWDVTVIRRNHVAF